ncbi:MAG: c-type cytochrome, partial [Lysobacteraceae bacterium]
DQDALSPQAQRGFALFAGRARCAVCHSGWRFTDDGFHDIGMPDADLGRGRLYPDEPTLQHAFKTPTLRGVADVGAYMHDGSLPSLTSVLAHYASGFSHRPSLDPDIRQLDLSTEERADLVAFMNSLSPAR